MNTRRKEMQERKNLSEKLPMVTRTNLENWKVLKKTNEGYLALPIISRFPKRSALFLREPTARYLLISGNTRGQFMSKLKKP